MVREPTKPGPDIIPTWGDVAAAEAKVAIAGAETMAALGDAVVELIDDPALVARIDVLVSGHVFALLNAYDAVPPRPEIPPFPTDNQP